MILVTITVIRKELSMATQLKHSKQRDSIVAFLRTRKDHPTADTIYMNIKQEIPNISLGTVYRNLALLSDNGDILKLSCDGKTDRYDALTHPHYHLMCNKCGFVSDVEMDLTDLICEEASKVYQGKILSHTIYFEGICPHCLSDNN